MSEQLSETLQWFPGHMKKAERLIEENLKLVDLVIEVLDARIPASSQNPNLQEILGDKPKLIAMLKSDLADAEDTKLWLKHFRDAEISAVAVDAVQGTGIKKLISEAKTLAEKNTHKLVKYGAKPRPARAMVIGIPNAGKSPVSTILKLKIVPVLPVLSNGLKLPTDFNFWIRQVFCRRSLKIRPLR